MPEPLKIATPSEREIVVTREFDAPRELVWLCYTKPDLMRRWYGLPDWRMTVCDIDLRVGGRWRFVTVSPGGYEMGSQGTYTEIVEPERLVQTETYDDDWTGGETVNTVTFTALSGNRTLATTNVLYASRAARDGALATPMATGMEVGFKRLDEVLASRPAG